MNTISLRKLPLKFLILLYILEEQKILLKTYMLSQCNMIAGIFYISTDKKEFPNWRSRKPTRWILRIKIFSSTWHVK